MLIVSEIFDEIKRVLGQCDETEVFARLNEALEELSNTGLWDPLVGYMDICTQKCQITLPDDVEVPLAINVGGSPADFRNKWFEFHLNGPGSECCPSMCAFAWEDKGTFPVFRDPIAASFVAAYPDRDEGQGTSIRVFGYDQNDKWIMTEDCNGVLMDGFDVPVLFGIGSGIPVTQKVKRITRIAKPITNGFVRLRALDPGNHDGATLLGLFRPNETQPAYRRINVSGSGCNLLCSCTGTSTWVRMRFRRKIFKLQYMTDAIPLHSLTAVKMMVQAIKKYEADLSEEYQKYFGLAVEALRREQKSRSGPNQMKVQFQRGAYAGSPGDNLI